MRGPLPGLGTPHPLGRRLPALYQDDDFVQQLLAGLDEVLSPVLCTLDNLDSYFDARLTPEDFLEFLAGWLGVELDETWPVERRRAVVAGAAGAYRLLGTVRGLRTAVSRLVDGDVEVEDSGGAAWSERGGGRLPGRSEPELVVRVRVADPASVPVERLESVVSAAKPAHVAHRIEVAKR
jgi:phage tail-like protein